MPVTEPWFTDYKWNTEMWSQSYFYYEPDQPSEWCLCMYYNIWLHKLTNLESTPFAKFLTSIVRYDKSNQ